MRSFYIFGAIPFLSAALMTSICTAIAIPVSRTFNFISQPSEGTYHDRPRPLGGGIALFVSLILVVGAGLLFVSLFPSRLSQSMVSELAPHVDGILSQVNKLVILFIGACFFFFLGLVDDVRALGPLTKLPIQLIGAGIVAAGGIRFSLFLEQGGSVPLILQNGLTIIWILFVTNAFNLLDNMDGQCAGISTVISLLLGVLAFQTNQLFLGTFLFVIAGVSVGFLMFNFPPSRIFAGDSGSLLLGYLLATSVPLFTFFRVDDPGHVYVSPLFLFVVPFYDTASVLWLRFREGRPLFRGDTSHFSHRLVERGMSEKGALGVVVLFTSLTGLFSLIMYQTNQTGAVLLGVATLTLLVLINLLENSP